MNEQHRECFARLAEIGQVLSQDLAIPASWLDSPFRAVKQRSPTIIGRYFERLVVEWLNRSGVQTTRRRHSDHDFVVRGVEVELKGATVNPDGGCVFNQVRDQRYEKLVLLCVLPHDARMWVLDKSVGLEKGTNQHAGKSDTRMIVLTDIGSPPKWLGSGDLSEALKALS